MDKKPSNRSCHRVGVAMLVSQKGLDTVSGGGGTSHKDKIISSAGRLTIICDTYLTKEP